MNRAAPAVIFIATVKLRVIELTHQNLQLHHPALLVRLQILGQTLLADEEVALRAAQEALRARRWLTFPGACRRPEPEPQLCVAFQQARLSTHRHHLTRSHLIMPLASPQLPSLKIDSLWTGRGIRREKKSKLSPVAVQCGARASIACISGNDSLSTRNGRIHT